MINQEVVPLLKGETPLRTMTVTSTSVVVFFYSLGLCKTVTTYCL